MALASSLRNFPMDSLRRLFLTGLAMRPQLALAKVYPPHKAVLRLRGKPSGLPFNASFIDGATQAELSNVSVYGSEDRKEFILETIGCGCAFFDYDNDG